MTKKHFQGIADVIRRCKPANSQDFIWLAEELADLFSEYNKLFDRDRFLKACADTSHNAIARLAYSWNRFQE